MINLAKKQEFKVNLKEMLKEFYTIVKQAEKDKIISPMVAMYLDSCNTFLNWIVKALEKEIKETVAERREDFSTKSYHL